MFYSNAAMVIGLGSILYVIYKAFHFPEKKEKYSQLAVILGILFTFIGIAIGLYFFNTTDIDNSINDLLSGLKTAFITSIAGQIASIYINWSIKSKNLDTGEKEDEVDIRDLLKALLSIEKSIAGDGETTLLTQIQKFRTTTQDHLSDLNQSFKDFASDMAENNSKALIEALENVMRDFNTKINEQFGDNFKKLNEAVGKMLEWQIEYKSFVEQTSSQLREVVRLVQTSVLSVEETQKIISGLVEKSSVYLETANKLDLLLNSTNSSLTSLNSISEHSKDLFPRLENNLHSLTNNVNNMITSVGHKVNSQVDTLNDSYLNMQKQIEHMVNQTAHNLDEQVTKLDQELGNELKKSLTSLGSQLISLSNRFVTDYTPLTDKLKRLVEMNREN